MVRGIKAVLFDFDYTLANSAPGVIACVNFALMRMKVPPASEKAICKTIGLSLSAAYEMLTGDADQQRSAEFGSLFISHAAEVMIPGTVLFDTVKPAVSDLRRCGLQLGIVSTKYRYRIEAILNRDGLAGCFDVIVGGEDVAAHKPDPAGLLQGLHRLRCRPHEALYVGDTVVDAETAERAEVGFVAVLSGVTPREAFRARKVCAMLEDLTPLPEFVKALSER